MIISKSYYLSPSLLQAAKATPPVKKFAGKGSANPTQRQLKNRVHAANSTKDRAKEIKRLSEKLAPDIEIPSFEYLKEPTVGLPRDQAKRVSASNKTKMEQAKLRWLTSEVRKPQVLPEYVYPADVFQKTT